MPDHEAAFRQLQAAQKQYEATLRVPVKDEFPVGTVLRWTMDANDVYRQRVAIKVNNHPAKDAQNWVMTGYQHFLTWSYLVVHIAKPNLIQIDMAQEWDNITVEPEAPLQMLTPDQSGYNGLVLRDTNRNLAWELRGSEWVRLYEED